MSTSRGRGRELRGLRAARLKRNISQRDLAKRAGVGQNMVSYLESGERSAYYETVDRLAAALGVEPEELTRDPEKGE